MTHLDERTARETLVYEALRFANWAAGEGICPVEGENAKAPEDFLMEFSNATNDEDWDTFAERISALPSSPVSELVERLDTCAVATFPIVQEAASTLTTLSTKNAALELEVKRLREALKPFSEAADELDERAQDHHDLWEHPVALNITVAHLREAHRALSTSPQGADHE